jgi:hypothetical protein
MTSAPRDEPSHAAGTGGGHQIARTGDPPIGGGTEQDLEQAIRVLQARMDEEFRISERLDSKQRQAFALAAAFFAVAQTVAFGSFAQGNLHSSARALIGILAVAAALVLVMVMHRLRDGEELRTEDDVRPDAIVKWCNEADDPGYVSARLVGELSEVAKRRSDSNKLRATNYDRVADVARWSLIATAVELLVAVALRI